MGQRKGKQDNRQRYRCLNCHRQWQSPVQPQRSRLKLWRQYIWQRQTAHDLAGRSGRCLDWVRTELGKISVDPILVTPQAAVFVADATFFRRDYGVCVFRLPHQGLNVYWRRVVSETIAVYRQARETLENQGFQFLAVVLDGRPGIRAVFSDIPVQMCHFHQKAIVRRRLTNRPKLLAGQSLHRIAQTLGETTEDTFTVELENWFNIHQQLLKERTVNPDTNRWWYTHRQLRAAYSSLKTNLPYLFTYQKYPNLNIPNTTNSLEGCFSNLKDLIGVHRGISPGLRTQMINEILNGKSP